MFGFDWAIAKYDTGPEINIDLNKVPGLSIPGEILRDRFDHVEAASGWTRDDTILGDDRGHVAGLTAPGATPEALFANDLLTNANVSLIDGLGAWLGNARQTLFGSNTAAFRDGNILLGGGGSDTIAGRGGFDLIDGDAWLNVRIKIMVGGTEYTAESMNTDKAVAGPNAGRVFTLSGAEAFGGRSLQSLLLDRTINPGNMSIVRELRFDDSGIDIARFAGNRAEYVIEGQGTAQGIRDVNNDGFISVRDLDNGQGLNGAGAVRRDATGKIAVDDTDLLKNIERLVFADQTVNLDDVAPPPATATTALTFNAVTLAGNNVPAANGVVGALTGFIGTFALGAGSSAGLALVANGNITATTAFADNQTRTLDAVITTATETLTETFSIRTGNRGADVLTGVASDNVIYGRGGNDTITGQGGDDFLFGQGSNDIIIGNGGNDNLQGGAGIDTLSGNDGADFLQGDDGNDTLSGGADADELQGGTGTDALDGGSGDDILNGGAGGDILIGGVGNDQIATGVANDNLADRIRYRELAEYGDNVTNFDANGTATQVDRVEFGGALNGGLDDGLADDNFLFSTGTGGAGTRTVTVGQNNGHAEALMLTQGEGVATAALGNAATVAAAFNAEFAITAANGEDALLVIDANNGNNFSVWHWIQTGAAAPNANEVDVAELTLVGIFAANATVTTASFDFFV